MDCCGPGQVTPCRLLVDGGAVGAWNMAVDEALLESAPQRGEACLRLYQWSVPTLSLGYFQRLAERTTHPESEACPVVRRSTGGGAILHDRELTYSFVLPWETTPRRSGHALSLYDAFHETLVETLSDWGVGADLFRPTVLQPPQDRKFLCFQRRTTGDVILQGNKIAGSAQRRQHRALLQHGSILLKRSPQAPQLAGIAETSGVEIQPQELVQRWSPRVAERLGLEFQVGQLSANEILRAEDLVRQRFSATTWTSRR